MREFWSMRDGHQDQLDEIRFRSLFNKFASLIKRVASKIVSLAPGKSVRVKFSIPHNITEASEQVGKIGGELTEYRLLYELAGLLEDLGPEVRVTLKDGRDYDRSSFFSGPYTKKLKEYKKQEAGTKKKAEKIWINHGIRGAHHMFSKMQQNIRSSMEILDYTLIATGSELTGKEKADFIVEYKKHDAKRLLKRLKVSLKTTEEGSAGKKNPLHVALQTSYKPFILSLLTGLSSRQLKDKLEFKTETQIEREVDRAKKQYDAWTKKVANAKSSFEGAKQAATKEKRKEVYLELKSQRQEYLDSIKAAKELYKDTLDYHINQLGKEVGVGGTSLSKYLDKLIDEFKAYQSTPKANRPEVKPERDKAGERYRRILKLTLEKKLKSKASRDEMIGGILKLGGIEKGLDIVSLGIGTEGRGKNKSVFYDAYSTLYNNGYKKDIEELMSAHIEGQLMATVEEDGDKLMFVIFMKGNKKSPLVKFSIWDHFNNARIDLPDFPAEEEDKVWSSMISKYGSGDDVTVFDYGYKLEGRMKSFKSFL